MCCFKRWKFSRLQPFESCLRLVEVGLICKKYVLSYYGTLYRWGFFFLGLRVNTDILGEKRTQSFRRLKWHHNIFWPTPFNCVNFTQGHIIMRQPCNTKKVKMAFVHVSQYHSFLLLSKIPFDGNEILKKKAFELFLWDAYCSSPRCFLRLAFKVKN